MNKIDCAINKFIASTNSFTIQIQENRWAPLISSFMLIPEDSVMKVWSLYENRTIRDAVNDTLKVERIWKVI